MPTAVSSNAPIAQITLTGPTVPLLQASDGSGNCTPANVTLLPSPAASYVTQNGQETLVFTGPGYINYMFADPTIRIVGIVFNSDGAKGSGSRGDNNLPMADFSFVPWGSLPLPGGGCYQGSGIQVCDAFVSSGAPGQYQWKYYVLFQDAAGVLGAIDPSDENDSGN